MLHRDKIVNAESDRAPGLITRCRGPALILLIIPGGPQDAGVFADVSRHLADRYTVVAYDPRGNSRSTFDGAPEELQLDVQAEDAAALIKALGGGAAYVFGPAAAPRCGLDLAARHPALVRTLVAHEPPSMMLLDDASGELAASEDLDDTIAAKASKPRGRKFSADIGLDDGPEQEEAPPEFAPTPEAAETFARVSGNFEYWLAQGVMALSLYRPDIDALRASKPRVVVAIGKEFRRAADRGHGHGAGRQAWNQTGHVPWRPYGL